MNKKVSFTILLVSSILLSACKIANKPLIKNSVRNNYTILLRHEMNNKLYNEISFELNKLKSSDNNAWNYTLEFKEFSKDSDYEIHLQSANRDIFTAPNSYKEKYVNDGLVANIDEVLPTDSNRAAIFTQYYNNKVYTIPYKSIDLGLMYYNEEIFEKLNLQIPRTKTEYLNVCQKIMEYNEEIDVPITPLAVANSTDFYQGALLIEGLAMTIDKHVSKKLAYKEANLSVTGYNQALEFILQLLENNYINMSTTKSKYKLSSYDEVIDAFCKGYVAMMPGYSFSLRRVNELSMDRANIMFFPALDDDSSNYGVNVPSLTPLLEGLMINKNTSDLATATKIALTVSKFFQKWFYQYGDTRACLYDAQNLSWQQFSTIPYNGVSELKESALNIIFQYPSLYSSLNTSNDVFKPLINGLINGYRYVDDFSLSNSISKAQEALNKSERKAV